MQCDQFTSTIEFMLEDMTVRIFQISSVRVYNVSKSISGVRSCWYKSIIFIQIYQHLCIINRVITIISDYIYWVGQYKQLDKKGYFRMNYREDELEAKLGLCTKTLTRARDLYKIPPYCI